MTPVGWGETHIRGLLCDPMGALLVHSEPHNHARSSSLNLSSLEFSMSICHQKLCHSKLLVTCVMIYIWIGQQFEFTLLFRKKKLRFPTLDVKRRVCVHPKVALSTNYCSNHGCSQNCLSCIVKNSMRPQGSVDNSLIQIWPNFRDPLVDNPYL